MGVEGPHALNRDGGHGVQQCTDVRAGARPTEHLADLVRESPGEREPDQLVVPREGVAALKLRTHMHLSRHVFDGHGGGFDKELEGKITARGARIRYDHGAMIYDEKVSKSGSFAKQRGRWLAAQYTYAGRFAGGAFRGLLHGNVDHFNKFLQMTLPPRLLLPIVLLLGTLFSPGANDIWLAGLMASCANFALAIPVKLWTNPLFWNGLFQIPLAVFATLRALAWMPAARKTFLHTEHV